MAEAVINHFEKIEPEKISDFESITGEGVTGSLQGQKFYAGNERLLLENRITINSQLSAEASRLSEESKSIVWFADDHAAIAVIAIADRIKANSKEAIQQLQSTGFEVYMLTGDAESTAKNIAKESQFAPTDSKAGIVAGVNAKAFRFNTELGVDLFVHTKDP